MSTFSGKCDFYDSVVAIHCDGDTKKLEEFLARTDIYVRGRDGRDHKVEVTDEKTACKYYPYLQSIAIFSDGRNKIILASDSFIDQEEREHIGWKVRDVLRYWRRCKRKKVPFSVDKCVEAYHWLNTDMFREIAKRVAKDGEKAEFDDLHDSLHEYFRRRWYDEMIRVGWSEIEAFDWCYKGFFTSKEDMKKRLGDES